MTTTTPLDMVEPRNEVERLLQEVSESGKVTYSVRSGDGFSMVGLRGTPDGRVRCSCHEELWIVSTESWTLYVRSALAGTPEFIRAPDPHAPERESLSIRLAGSSRQSVVVASVTPLYDEMGRPLAEQFAWWEALRAKYGGNP